MLWHRLLQEPTASLPSSACLAWRTCLHTAKGSGVLTKPNLVPCLGNTEASRHERSKKGLGWCQEERKAASRCSESATQPPAAMEEGTEMLIKIKG